MRPILPSPAFAGPGRWHGLFATLLAMLMALSLSGCASNARLKEVRALAAEAPKLNGYVELSQRYRDTYLREQPYLSPQADAREQAIDAQRRAAYEDLVALHEGAVTYLRTLGALAGGDQFDPGDQIKAMAKGIKAWPDTGLTDRYVNAYAGLARVLARAVSRQTQDRAVQDMLRDGYEPLRDTLDAMSDVLRYYDKNHDNEQKIVLGMLEMEIPFVDRPQERLLTALAKAHRREKQAEYRLLGVRHTLAARNVRELRERHEALYRALDPAPAAPAARVAATTMQGATP